MRVTAILAAGGAGLRMGHRKQLVQLCGKPLVAWSLEAFARCGAVEDLVVACAAEERARFVALAKDFCANKDVRFVSGGDRRQDSVLAALRVVPPSSDYLIVHDGARPFVGDDEITQVLEGAKTNGAAILAVPVTDTIKLVGERGCVVRTIPREQLWAAQTPQAFSRETLVRAYETAELDGFVGTDCAMLVERAGLATVAVIEGTYENVKITTPQDLAVAERIAQRRMAGLAL